MCCACAEGTPADRSENAPTQGFLSPRPTFAGGENRPQPKRRFAFAEDTVSLGHTSEREDGHNHGASPDSAEAG